MTNISIYSIPHEIFVTNIIIPYLIPYDNLDFKHFITYREVSRKFQMYFRDTSIVRKIRQHYSIMYVKHKNEKYIDEWKYIQKLTNQFYKNIYPDTMIEAFGGLEEMLNLPVLYGAKWYLINRLYTMDRNYIGGRHDPWEKIKSKMSSPIMRGCDEFGRHFIVFRYYNYSKKCIQLEFIYEGSISIQNRFLWTYIGEGNFTFIGSASIQNNIYKTLGHKSWLMLKYILNNKKMFVANVPDNTNFPPKIKLPHGPIHDDYFSDSESEDESQPEFTLKPLDHVHTNILSLDY